MAQNAARCRKGKKKYKTHTGFLTRYKKYGPQPEKLLTKQHRRTILENFNHVRSRH